MLCSLPIEAALYNDYRRVKFTCSFNYRARVVTFQKLQERKKMLEVGSFQDPGTKDKWLPIVTMDFMSSDESASDEGKEVLLTKPLQWESLCVAEFKRSLDDAAIEQKSPLAKRQMKPRKRGIPSDKPKPCGNYPTWTFLVDN